MKDNHMILCVIAFFLGYVVGNMMGGPSIGSLLGDNKRCACGKRSGSCTCGK